MTHHDDTACFSLQGWAGNVCRVGYEGETRVLSPCTSQPPWACSGSYSSECGRSLLLILHLSCDSPHLLGTNVLKDYQPAWLKHFQHCRILSPGQKHFSVLAAGNVPPCQPWHELPARGSQGLWSTPLARTGLPTPVQAWLCSQRSLGKSPFLLQVFTPAGHGRGFALAMS